MSRLVISDTKKYSSLGQVRGYYWQHNRHDLPWRYPGTAAAFDSYKILASELINEGLIVKKRTNYSLH